MRTWTCQRVQAGTRCAHVNPKRKQICEACGKRRPVTQKPKHMVALELDYEGFVALNGGDACGICGRKPTTRRLDRDHDHETHRPRGLLCHRCNRALPSRNAEAWLVRALAYVRRQNGNSVP